MTKKELYSERQITKLEIEDVTYFRVIHSISGMVTNVTVFSLTKDPEIDNEVLITELSYEDTPDDLKAKLLSKQYEIDVLEEDKELITQAFETKREYFRNIADKKLTIGLKRRMFEFIEVGGHFFAYVYEEEMPYTKLYHLTIDPVAEEVYVDGIHPALLPAVVEAISVKLLSNTQALTIQIDEGVYARISKINETAAMTTVVGAYEDEDNQTSLKVQMGFMLKKAPNGEWLATIIQEEEKLGANQQMERSLQNVYQELLTKVYEKNGDSTLDNFR